MSPRNSLGDAQNIITGLQRNARSRRALPFDPVGSIVQYLSNYETMKKEDIVLKAGAEKVVSSLADDGVGRNKATLRMRLNEQGVVGRGRAEVSLVHPPSNAILIPVFD
jgi:hypothetical protein